jgi:cytochrome c oxidase cbb3-type subunit 4
MDLNDIRSAITVVSFIAFALIVVWAWRTGRDGGFDAAARLPLMADSDDPIGRANKNPGAQR